MPGDPAAAVLGLEARPEQIEALRHELWLDRPFIVQYFHWAGQVLQGDLGDSLAYKMPISSIFAQRLPVTLYLAFWAFLASNILGVTAGVICAVRRGGILDQAVSLFANLGIAIPVFWLGVVGIYIFGLKLEWLPIMGWTSPLDNFWQSSRQALMPVIFLAFTASIAR